MPRRRYGAKYRSKIRPRRSRRKPNLALKRVIRATTLAQSEDKMQCVDTGPQSLTSGTWYTTAAFSIAQGDDSASRDGNQIMGNYAKIRMALVSPTDRVAFVRIMVIRYKGTRGAFASSQLPADHLACVTPTMRAKYTVVRDFVIALNPRTTGAAEDSRVMFKKLFIRDRNKKVYDDASGAAQDAQKGQLFFCVLHGSNFGSGTDDPEVDAQIEYHWKDI